MKKGMSIIILLSILLTSFVACSPIIDEGDPVSSGSPAVSQEPKTCPSDFIIDIESRREAKILQLTDTQIINSDMMRTENRLSAYQKELWKPENKESLLYRYIRKLIQDNSPDLIVITGDVIYGEFDDDGSNLIEFIEFMDSFKIPWTLVWGNHDNESHVGVEWQCQKLYDSEYCLFKRGNTTGNSNFTIAVRQGGNVVFNLIMMDSNGCSNTSDSSVRKNIGLDSNQINWYQDACNDMKDYAGKQVPSLVFLHIPFRAFADSVVKYGYTSTKHSGYGNKAFTPITIPVNNDGDFGILNSDFDALWDSNHSFFKALKRNGTKGVFAGHLHKNNSSVSYSGIRFTFGLKTGEYDSHEKNLLGGTMITIEGENFLVEHKYVTFL